MFPSFVLLAVALTCRAITLPFTKIERPGSYLHGLPHSERHRSSIFQSARVTGIPDIPATNLDFVQYTVSIGVGNPPTFYDLVVDTGSSNTFVGTGKKYVTTRTSFNTGQKVNVTYGQGFFTGDEFLDQVTLAPGAVITNQSIGDATKFADFPNVDGIIGLGPVDLTVGTLQPDVNSPIPTVTNNALAQGLISSEILGVSFAPATSNPSTNGAISIGETDSSLFTGPITFVPITSTFPSSLFWGINVSKAKYGTSTIISQTTAGIVDTGTTLILLADDHFAKYQSKIVGSFVDDATGLFVIPPSQIAKIKPFTFVIGGTSFTLDAAAQLLPQAQNTIWGGKPGVQYGYLGPLGTSSGQGLDFIIGQKFMERYYAIFDTGNKRVGFASTTHTA